MSNASLPYRWDVLSRYRHIEIIALWEGRLNAEHLCQSFSIGRQAASKDLQRYRHDIAPGNLIYDNSGKFYRPSENFVPRVTRGHCEEYLHLLATRSELEQTFTSLHLGISNAEVLKFPVRQVDPAIIRAIVSAAREQRRLEVDYVSLHDPQRDGRIIVPHTLVYTGRRWHVRAWCEKNQEFRDFVLSRFRGSPELMDPSPHSLADDLAWNSFVTIRLAPDSRLSAAQREIIEIDYGMEDGELCIKVRGPLVHYALEMLRVDLNTIQAQAEAQQIVVVNPNELRPYLF